MGSEAKFHLIWRDENERRGTVWQGRAASAKHWPNLPPRPCPQRRRRRPCTPGVGGVRGVAENPDDRLRLLASRERDGDDHMDWLWNPPTPDAAAEGRRAVKITKKRH